MIIFFSLMEPENGVVMKAEDLEKELKALEDELKEREDALPAHSIKPQQILLIEELEALIEKKKKQLAELKGTCRSDSTKQTDA